MITEKEDSDREERVNKDGRTIRRINSTSEIKKISLRYICPTCSQELNLIKPQNQSNIPEGWELSYFKNGNPKLIKIKGEVV